MKDLAHCGRIIILERINWNYIIEVHEKLIIQTCYTLNYMGFKNSKN